jgi:hypothetical protein
VTGARRSLDDVYSLKEISKRLLLKTEATNDLLGTIKDLLGDPVW